jgi:hypothetical protein
LYQGTTLVVPQRIKENWALAPAMAHPAENAPGDNSLRGYKALTAAALCGTAEALPFVQIRHRLSLSPMEALRTE